MSEIAPFVINLSQRFPHLPFAPIVEAVIHWQARANPEWQPDELRKILAEQLPDYPKVNLQHLHEVFVEDRVGDKQTAPAASRRVIWQGVRLQHQTEPYIAQFTRDGLVFSRLRPYEDWERFSDEARRLWKVFVDVAAPAEIQRIGVRFINRITSAGLANLKDYLKEPPSLISQLPMRGFLYQSTFDVPGHALGIRILKTVQPVDAGKADESGLIIDIDVFTNKPLPCEDQVLDDYLPKMQWLKNWVFFYLLTYQAIESFK